jgi:hypothetical protein
MENCHAAYPKSNVDRGRKSGTGARFGLAFFFDDASQSWGVTRSTPGSQFDALTAGRRVRLQVEAHQTFSVVRECKVLD